MIELPEAINLSRQLRETVFGKIVKNANPPTKPHKLCWFAGDPADYDAALRGTKVNGAEGFGIFVDIIFSNCLRLSIDDGINMRYLANKNVDRPEDHQLRIDFEDGSSLAFTVAMYGGIVLHDPAKYDNEYYIKSRNSLSPIPPLSTASSVAADADDGFSELFYRRFSESKPSLSAKAFLATEQRFPGIGNGVLQDILFTARIHPKRKILTLSESEQRHLLKVIVDVLRRMTEQGGRDTEKDIFGVPGGYKTVMSKNTMTTGCPLCSGEIKKEAYLGGSVYYCPKCQK
ncbi:endonuclease VIII [Candidatus Nomurabacteria bacterium]|nr:endonuclease VIII [Candidatus Nomurabacteria bacterium]